MKLEGSLDTFPLRELIDMVVYSSVTGVLNIYGTGPVGHLYFRDSTLYHAERGPAKGVDALAELLELSRGGFSFVSEVVTAEDSLYGSASIHLQTAERLAARWRQIRAYIPSLDLIPNTLASREATMRRMSPAHHPVLDAIDGCANLRQIAVAIGWAEIDVAEAAAQMSVDGLLELSKQRRQELHQELTPPTHQGPGDGLFDRLLARTQSQPRPSEAEPTRTLAPESGPRAGEDLILRLLRS